MVSVRHEKYSLQLSQVWILVNDFYSFLDYRKGDLTSIDLYFPQCRTNRGIVQDCGILCYWVLAIHIGIDRGGQDE